MCSLEALGMMVPPRDRVVASWDEFHRVNMDPMPTAVAVVCIMPGHGRVRELR